MLTIVAKKPKTPGDGEPKKRVGRPPTGVVTDSFCCRAPATLIDAYDVLSDITGSTRAGTELLRAAEDHLVKMYKLIKADPGSPLIRDITGGKTAQFLTAAERFLQESKRWPLQS